MFDIQVLKEHANLIELAERDTTLRHKTHNEFSAPCPFCGGRDRFNVQADKWLCRNCTQGKWQDVIAYVMRRENCDFLTACDLLGAPNALPARPRVKPPEPARTEPPSAWQSQSLLNKSVV